MDWSKHASIHHKRAKRDWETKKSMQTAALMREELKRVRALNQTLVEALRELLELVESNAPDGYYTEHRSIGDARAALALAEAKAPGGIEG